MRAEQVTEPLAEDGEGPCWWPTGELKYVDMSAGDVLTLTADGTVHRVHCGTVAAALRPRAGGGAVVALERCFALARDDDLSDLTPLPEVWDGSGVRFNDGGCDPQGRFYCGTMAYAKTPGAASMFRLSPGADGGYATERLWGGATISNGFMFSPDGSLAYYNDSATRRTDVFDYDPQHGLTHRRPFAGFEDADDEVVPDGLCVDSEGAVWVAAWAGSQVRRYLADGRLDGVVEVGASRVSACTFGGPALDILYITTSKEGVPAGAEPAAGALFAARPGVVGQRALTFAG